jgi:hypothetical protein
MDDQATSPLSPNIDRLPFGPHAEMTVEISSPPKSPIQSPLAKTAADDYKPSGSLRLSDLPVPAKASLVGIPTDPALIASRLSDLTLPAKTSLTATSAESLNRPKSPVPVDEVKAKLESSPADAGTSSPSRSRLPVPSKSRPESPSLVAADSPEYSSKTTLSSPKESAPAEPARPSLLGRLPPLSLGGSRPAVSSPWSKSAPIETKHSPEDDALLAMDFGDDGDHDDGFLQNISPPPRMDDFEDVLNYFIEFFLRLGSTYD